MRFIVHQSCLALGLIWPLGSQMPGWGWQHQSHQGHKLKVNFCSHPHLQNLGGGQGQGLYIYSYSLSPPAPSSATLSIMRACACSCPLHVLPDSSREGFLLPALPSTLPGAGGLAPTKFSLLLNPETSPLILSHWMSQRLSLRKHSSPFRDQGWPR